jgi:hypothetical protein
MILVLISRKTRYAGYVTLMGAKRTAYRVFVEKRKRRSHFESLGVDGRKILK